MTKQGDPKGKRDKRGTETSLLRLFYNNFFNNVVHGVTGQFIHGASNVLGGVLRNGDRHLPRDVQLPAGFAAVFGPGANGTGDTALEEHAEVVAEVAAEDVREDGGGGRYMVKMIGMSAMVDTVMLLQCVIID